MNLNRENLVKQITQKYHKLTLVLTGIAVLMTASIVMADDTEIYFPSTAATEPNILFIISNNTTMQDGISGSTYDPTVTYSQTTACNGQACTSTYVYKENTQSLQWTQKATSVTGLCTGAQTSLNSTGLYTGITATVSQGNSNCATNGSTEHLAMGNYINWANQTNGISSPKIAVTQSVLNNVIASTQNAKFGLMAYGVSSNGGGAFSTGTISSSTYTAAVNDMNATFTGTTVTNRYALTTTVNQIVIPSNSTKAPMAETLWDADQYFKGSKAAFTNTNYTTPITSSCQQNIIIYIADGISTSDTFNSASPTFLAQNVCTPTSTVSNGDCDGDHWEPNPPSPPYPSSGYPNGGSHYLDDVAKAMADNKVSVYNDSRNGVMAGHTGTNIVTYTIGLGGNYTACPSSTDSSMSATDLLCRTGDSNHGRGGYYYAATATDLSEAIRKIVVSVLVVNSSFVAPVVPVSPDNRTSSGNYVYMGFFKPQDSAFWYGNLKKFQIDSTGTIYDANGAAATYVDSTTGFTYFKSTAQSYWSTSADGGTVDAGGAGALLQARTLSTRKIYTYIPGTSTTNTLSDTTNAFTGTNGFITTTVLNVTANSDKNSLINFIYGYDAYGTVPTATRTWIMGDILHSRPAILQYALYTTTATTGTGSIFDCSLNKTMIYVGSNDGMLHAFKDCDGSEAWAFIPPDQLSNLQNIATGVITPPSRSFYYVDASPKIYLNDADGDGNITTGGSDQAVVIFGERRGGTYYYALDVTDLSNPKFLWQINLATQTVKLCQSTCTTTTSTGETGGLTFSDPTIGKVLLNVNNVNTSTPVFFVGGGYDTAEDSRNTATQTYSGTQGRGLFVFNVLTGAKVWEYSKTSSGNANMIFPFPSELTVFDSNSDGYLDTVYVGDTGGQIWKFNVMATVTSSWIATEIFASNVSANGSTMGRKIFYPPDVTIQSGYNMLFFGTGDREHPKSTAVVDRLYGVQDRASSLITETAAPALKDATAGTVTLSSSDYGWYIMLNDSTKVGEKSLAGAAVFNKTVYFTTYVPVNATDPCNVNLGNAYIWAVNYLTTGATIDLNRDGTNDRTAQMGNGIPSGIVIGMGQTGAYALVGVGGAVTTAPATPGGRVIPLYWREIR